MFGAAWLYTESLLCIKPYCVVYSFNKISEILSLFVYNLDKISKILVAYTPSQHFSYIHFFACIILFQMLHVAMLFSNKAITKKYTSNNLLGGFNFPQQLISLIEQSDASTIFMKHIVISCHVISCRCMYIL